VTVRFAAPKLRPATVVELVGPPGAGKSSVFRALRTSLANIEAPPDIEELGWAPLIENVPPVLGTLIARGAIRCLTPAQLRVMVYLRALSRIVERAAPGSGSVFVFDQGPLYLLNRPRLLDERLATWREEMFQTWASLLDAVFWLDAPDAVLVERIDGRSDWHRLKGAPLATALDSFEKTRAVHEEALSRLEALADGPVILRFDTSRASPDAIADAIDHALNGAAPIPDAASSPPAAPSKTRA
jgi:broad-specificity NMP kinase